MPVLPICTVNALVTKEPNQVRGWSANRTLSRNGLLGESKPGPGVLTPHFLQADFLGVSDFTCPVTALIKHVDYFRCAIRPGKLISACFRLERQTRRAPQMFTPRWRKSCPSSTVWPMGKVYPGVGADIVMKSITLTDPAVGDQLLGEWEDLTAQHPWCRVADRPSCRFAKPGRVYCEETTGTH